MKDAATVLVVDDDEDCRLIYGAALRAAGYHVLLAPNGALGVDRAVEHHPSVILLDIAMPIVDGRAALQSLRADQSTRDIPVVAITAMESMHNRGDLERAGFDAVLLKPLEPKLVVTAVRQLLDAAP